MAFDIGHGTEVEIGRFITSAYVFTELEGVTSFTPPVPEIEQVDVTHMKSPGRVRQFISGMVDMGEAEVVMNLDVGSDTDELLEEIAASRETVQLRYTIKTKIKTFTATLQSYEIAPNLDDKMEATATFKISEEVV